MENHNTNNEYDRKAARILAKMKALEGLKNKVPPHHIAKYEEYKTKLEIQLIDLMYQETEEIWGAVQSDEKAKLRKKEIEQQNFGHILDDPNLTIDRLVSIIGRIANSAHLNAIAYHEKWRFVKQARMELIRNPDLPVITANSIIKLMTIKEVRHLLDDGNVKPSMKKLLKIQLKKLQLKELTPEQVTAKTEPNGAESRKISLLADLVRRDDTSENIILTLAENANISSKILLMIARNERWISNIKVKKALIRNPNTPERVKSYLLTTLDPDERDMLFD